MARLPKKIIAGAVALAMKANLAQAGFMEDYFNSAGAASTSTSAGFVHGRDVDVVTGGSFTFRSPNRDFQPFYVTPPNLKAGCGGIDIFLGAFGIANKQEMINFLRNVGQNAAGLAFSLALQSMAPDLMAQIREWSGDIQNWTRQFRNSCDAAKTLLAQSGAGDWIAQTAFQAGQALGTRGDYTDAQQRITSMAEVKKNVADVLNTDGAKLDGFELNLTWALLNNGKFSGFSQALTVEHEKELILALFGTTIMRAKGGTNSNDPDDVIVAESRPPLYDGEKALVEFLGLPGAPTTQVRYYRCDDQSKCMQPVTTDSLEVGFAKVIRDKALRIRDGIRGRNAYGGPPSLDEDIQMLRNTSGLPIYRLIEASAYQKYPGVSETLLMSYCDAMAVELVSHYIQDMAANLDKAAATAEISGPGGKVKLKHVESLRARAQVLSQQAAEARKAVYALISAQTGIMTQLLHVEKALYGNLSADVAANLRFGKQ